MAFVIRLDPNGQIERIKELETLLQNLFVRPVHSCPALGNQFDGFAFGSPEFAVLQVRIVDDLGNLFETLVAHFEALHERFEGAVVARVCELTFEHVEADRTWVGLGIGRENKPGPGIDEVLD